MMKKITKLALLAVAAAFLVAALPACSSGSGGEGDSGTNNTPSTGGTSGTTGGTTGGNTGGGGASTGSWNFKARNDTVPVGANAWDATTALTADVELDADSGTGTFVVLSGAKAKYNNGLQFSNGQSAKNLFNITGTGSVSIEYNAPSAATTDKPFFLYADGDEANKVTATSGSPSGTYTVTISGETKFYSNDCRIITVNFK